jgi:hypothetical protein
MLNLPSFILAAMNQIKSNHYNNQYNNHHKKMNKNSSKNKNQKRLTNRSN